MIRVTNLEFHYDTDDFSLQIPALEIDKSDTVALIGPSGTGKTTLLNLMAGCSIPRRGKICVMGSDVSDMSERSRRAFRIRNIGMVFQEFELMDHLCVLDNVLLPYRISTCLTLDASVNKRAVSLINEVGLGDKVKRNVQCLSQGERQRVAVCRAFITKPSILLCDEPTGNLDPDNKKHILDIMLRYTEENKGTLVSVTHDQETTARFKRTINITSIQHSASSIKKPAFNIKEQE